MSIQINGIEKPKNCFDCPCIDAEFEECAAREHYLLPKDEYGAVLGEVPDWCPITEPQTCEDDPRADVYYLAEKIGIHRLYALVVALRGEPESCEDTISRQAAIDALNGLIDRFEQILRDIRETKVDDSVCGMCEYDGAYIGQSGDWCNECPGFDKDDCFKLSDECRKRWLKSVNLPAVQPQPEIIRCKDCIYYRWEIDMCDRPYSTAHNIVHEDDYCSKAERRTDEQTDQH